MLKVAIQGGVASFHDIAARNYFKSEKEIKTISCDTFRDLCNVLKEGKADYAVMAIENAIAGSILQNYALLKEYNFYIIGEIQLRIELNLMAMPGVSLDQLEKVRSHYMAILQCEDFLLKHPGLKIQEYHDTADSARDIKASNDKKTAAIAGRFAAEVYNLDILAESIETEKRNFTRFLVLTKDKKFKVDHVNKATLCFELPDKVGALAHVMNVIVENNINLTKIQSLPILGKPNQYTFYVDCEFDDYEDFKKCIRIKSIVKNLKILGEYKKGITIHDYKQSRKA
ncbi:MAG: prephenate dehydratase [Cytophagaceae bacterium]